MDGASEELTNDASHAIPQADVLPPELPSPNIVSLKFKDLLTNEALLSELEAGVLRSFQQDYGQDVEVAAITEIITDNEGTVTLVKVGEKVVGAGLITDHPQGAWGEGTQPSQEISHVFILPEFRGKKLGTKLMEEQIRQCVKKGGNVWAIMMRGEEQLKDYRNLIRREAEKHGKQMSDWVDDKTTNSHAYAYRRSETEGKADIIFQGRSPNGPTIRSSAEINADDSLSPDKLLASGTLTEMTFRRDFGDGVSKSVGVTEKEFNKLYADFGNRFSLNPLLGLNGCTPLVLSVKVNIK